MADIERWITINGTHIPIMKGESKMSAVSRFIKGKRKVRKMKREDDWNDEAENLQWRMEKEHFKKYPNKEFKNEMDMMDHMIETGRMNEDLYYDMSDTKKDKSEFGLRLNEYMKEKYGKNYDKLSDRNVKGYNKSNGKYRMLSAEEKAKIKEKAKASENVTKKVKSTTPRVTKPKGVKAGGRINYDDDLVRVVDSKGKVVYQGIEDYNPMRDGRYEFVPTSKNNNKGYYKVGNYYVYKVD